MLIGFGLDVPTAGGVTNVNPDAAACGSVSGTKQMLADLGYDPGPVDSNVGSLKFQQALAQFASQRGLSFVGQLGPNICHPLTQEWQAKKGAQMAPAAPATGTQLTFSPTTFSPQQMSLIKKAPAIQFVSPYTVAAPPDISAMEPQYEEPPAEEKGVLGWWKARSTTEKAVVGVAALAVVGGIVYLVV
jgi:hypothetical protein